MWRPIKVQQQTWRMNQNLKNQTFESQNLVLKICTTDNDKNSDNLLGDIISK